MYILERIKPDHERVLDSNENLEVINDNTHHYFVRIAVERLGCWGIGPLLSEGIGSKSERSGDPPTHQYLIQRILVAVQRGNAAAVLWCARLRDEG